MDNLKVGEALNLFYGNENIGDEAFVKKINFIKVGILKITFPNFRQRRTRIYLHDINHLLTGYDTSQLGEGEVAAYELASGFPLHCWIGYLYAPFSFLSGLILNPVRVYRAFVRGMGAKNACHARLTKEEILRMQVKELKLILQIPEVS